MSVLFTDVRDKELMEIPHRLGRGLSLVKKWDMCLTKAPSVIKGRVVEVRRRASSYLAARAFAVVECTGEAEILAVSHLIEEVGSGVLGRKRRARNLFCFMKVNRLC